MFQLYPLHARKRVGRYFLVRIELAHWLPTRFSWIHPVFSPLKIEILDAEFTIISFVWVVPLSYIKTDLGIQVGTASGVSSDFLLWEHFMKIQEKILLKPLAQLELPLNYDWLNVHEAFSTFSPKDFSESLGKTFDHFQVTNKTTISFTNMPKAKPNKADASYCWNRMGTRSSRKTYRGKGGRSSGWVP